MVRSAIGRARGPESATRAQHKGIFRRLSHLQELISRWKESTADNSQGENTLTGMAQEGGLPGSGELQMRNKLLVKANLYKTPYYGERKNMYWVSGLSENGGKGGKQVPRHPAGSGGGLRQGVNGRVSHPA